MSLADPALDDNGELPRKHQPSGGVGQERHLP